MNWGVIGSGRIVESLMNAFVESAQEGDAIKAISSRTKDSPRIKFLMEKYNIPYAYDNIDEMCKNDEFDFMYIASPNGLHYPHSKQVLLNGKNVICEKPFTSTLAQARDLFQTAKEKNLMIFEAIANIQKPNYHFIRDKLEAIAPIRIVQMNNSQYSSKYDNFKAGAVPTPNVFNPEMGGGALYDLGIYNLHFVIGLFGVPQEYKYFATRQINGIDTSGVLVMRYDGFLCSLIASKETRNDAADYIQGEKGFIKSIGGGGGLREVYLEMYSGEKETVNLHTCKAGHFHEIAEFNRISREKDWDAYEKLVAHSLTVIEMAEKIRKDAGIVFAADK